MPVLHFHGVAALGQRDQLVTEANAENRLYAQQFFNLLYLERVVFRVAGTVGEHYAGGVEIENLFGGSAGGEHAQIEVIAAKRV